MTAFEVGAAGRAATVRTAARRRWLIDYVVGEPLHSAMVRRMMLGIKQRAQDSWRASQDGPVSAAA